MKTVASRLRVVVVAFVVAGTPLVARRLQPSGGDAANGKKLFMTYYCYSCHGTEGQGGAGPRLIARATADPLIRYVRKPTGGNMPPYTSKVIADQQLIDINAYLRSLPPSPPARSIPLLQQ
jgi:mono/diheme cytochrome c family protein